MSAQMDQSIRDPISQEIASIQQLCTDQELLGQKIAADDFVQNRQAWVDGLFDSLNRIVISIQYRTGKKWEPQEYSYWEIATNAQPIYTKDYDIGGCKRLCIGSISDKAFEVLEDKQNG